MVCSECGLIDPVGLEVLLVEDAFSNGFVLLCGDCDPAVPAAPEKD
jgi:hypothetical protein